ncbi:Uncharacterised protein [Vibrio cholerae]|nr:Uncharacterised protein [Vibrio cholerae]CSD38585.1 Uncharacterised protein [Vibrio cholerae]
MRAKTSAISIGVKRDGSERVRLLHKSVPRLFLLRTSQSKTYMHTREVVW